jgi:diguanylate cyclase (GGDEF)-like protein
LLRQTARGFFPSSFARATQKGSEEQAPMTVGPMPRGGARLRADAVMRLARAQDEHARLVVIGTPASGNDSKARAESRLGAARACVASREQWLHWIDEGESLEPWADGEWAQIGTGAREHESQGADLARATHALRRELEARANQGDRQAGADLDQTRADFEQRAADSDQSLSDREQTQADRDQYASDRDQAVDDWRLAQESVGLGYATQLKTSRVEREEVSRERDLTAEERSRATAQRLTTAAQRDEVAARRDRAAATRDRDLYAADQAADRNDTVLDEQERQALDAGDENVIRMGSLRVAAAAVRRDAARERATAADDRASAAVDRDRAAADRRNSGLDELTGMFRRGSGELALTREIDRWRRAGQSLMLAVIDVDSLKAVNDLHGHAEGDALLRDVATAITSAMRSYDATVRWGGDEFVCAIADVTPRVASDRIREIQAALEARRPGASISAGLAALNIDDTLETLIARADAALYRGKTDRGRLTASAGTA